VSNCSSLTLNHHIHSGSLGSDSQQRIEPEDEPPEDLPPIDISEDLPPIYIYYSSHPYVHLKPCDDADKGLGLFAVAPIKEGEVVWKYSSDPYGRVTAKIYTKLEAEEVWKDDLDWFWHWAYRCGENLYLGPASKDSPSLEATYYQNHGCDPSTWWQDDFTLIARRDILPGEEITFDYGTSESDDEELSLGKCLCGSPICRGEIGAADFLKPELIKRYRTHFQSYQVERQKQYWGMKYEEFFRE